MKNTNQFISLSEKDMIEIDGGNAITDFSNLINHAGHDILDIVNHSKAIIDVAFKITVDIVSGLLKHI